MDPLAFPVLTPACSSSGPPSPISFPPGISSSCTATYSGTAVCRSDRIYASSVVTNQLHRLQKLHKFQLHLFKPNPMSPSHHGSQDPPVSSSWRKATHSLFAGTGSNAAEKERRKLALCETETQPKSQVSTYAELGQTFLLIWLSTQPEQR